MILIGAVVVVGAACVPPPPPPPEPLLEPGTCYEGVRDVYLAGPVNTWDNYELYDLGTSCTGQTGESNDGAFIRADDLIEAAATCLALAPSGVDHAVAPLVIYGLTGVPVSDDAYACLDGRPPGPPGPPVPVEPYPTPGTCIQNGYFPAPGSNLFLGPINSWDNIESHADGTCSSPSPSPPLTLIQATDLVEAATICLDLAPPGTPLVVHGTSQFALPTDLYICVPPLGP